MNVINQIKIGSKGKNGQRRTTNKTAEKAGVSSIVISVPQALPSFSQPYHPFHIQSQPVTNLPLQINQPTSVLADEQKRATLDTALNEYDHNETVKNGNNVGDFVNGKGLPPNFIWNPWTGRPIAEGGPTHRNLKRKGLM